MQVIPRRKQSQLFATYVQSSISNGLAILNYTAFNTNNYMSLTTL